MRILLVHPRFPYRGRDAFPLGLGYLAAVVMDRADVEVVDDNFQRFEVEKILKGPPDMIGISSTTPSFPRALEILREIKEHLKDTLVVFGGTHVSFCPEDALSAGADVVVRGEGEATFVELVKGKPLSEIKGISFKSGGVIRHNPDRGLIENLDSLPFPAWEAFPLKNYGIMSLITSRGCSYSCVYCCAARFWKRRVRYRSPENVLEELRRIAELGYSRVRFMDSTFTLDKKHALRICELIVKEGLDISWSCETRADSLDDEILEALAKSGCTLLCLGVDSGSQKVLDETGRKMRVETIKTAFRKIREFGMFTRAYVTFGFPGESEESVRETIRVLREIQPDQVLLSLATAYPGTELWSRGDDGALRLHPSWIAKFHGHGFGGRLFIPKGLSKKDYMRLADYLWKEVKKLNKARKMLKSETAQ